jgi:hypothetical protein
LPLTAACADPVTPIAVLATSLSAFLRVFAGSYCARRFR